ncbi:MAG: hypothetical protein ABSG89_06200 [Bacteroidales bacterium]|jgi:hypothetical protein
MDFSVAYEIKKDYLLVKVIGEFDYSKAHENFLKWIEQANKFALNRVLCDITLVKGLDTKQPTMNLFTISEYVANSMPKNFSLAILETSQQMESCEFGENVIVNRGGRVKATSNLYEALEWLSVNPLQP